MLKNQQSFGECPFCGGNLYLMRSKTGGRYIKCGEVSCSGSPDMQMEDNSLRFKPSFSYPIPRSGKIIKSGYFCEKHNLPVLVIVKGKPKNMLFYWVKGPCFVCPESGKCDILTDLKKEEY